MCYAYIYAKQNRLERIGVQMTYCNLDTEEIRYFREIYTFETLTVWFTHLIEDYRKWADWQIAWKKQRQEKEYKDLVNRLSRIEGQVRGIKRMVEEDAYCTDILMQVSAVNAALNSFNKVLLANHIKTCVRQDILDGREDTVDDLVVTLQKLMK